MIKKFTLFVATFLLVVLGVNAQTLNNPKDADGFYIVKWDCANNTWAASNDFEVDQTFTFAIDITGTPFVDWLKGTPTAAGATRSIAINKWSNYGEVNGLTNRLKQISGNIYGATWNIAQMGAAGSTFDVVGATGIDSVVFIYGQVFGFEYTADNAGAGWWMWPDGVPEGTAIDPGAGNGAIFKTLPHTGTKTSPEFYNDDYPGMFDFDAGLAAVQGYTLACAVPTGIQTIQASNSPVVGHEYYNFQGQKLSQKPQTGLFIDKAIKADGTTVSTKVFKPLK